MKKTSLKKLSTAVIIATGILGVTAVEAAPKISIKVTTPAGSASADKSALGKGVPWSPCTATATPFAGVATSSAMDNLQFDLEITNADDDKDTAKGQDYDVYVIFNNPAAAGTASDPKFYVLKNQQMGSLGAQNVVAYNTESALETATASSLRFMSKTEFGVSSFKSTLFGAAISFDANGLTLSQGLWTVTAIMTRPDIAPGGILPTATAAAPAIVTGFVDATVGSAATATTLATGTKALLSPQNWAAWSTSPFILGTPFKNTYGTVPYHATAGNIGKCL